jgi:hypothetical protein
MSMTFTKLFSSITASTIWAARDQTRIVWITMLAMSDMHGRVWASIPGLANIARVDIEACETALEELMQPDRYSRTKDHEGRRIEPIDGGWRLLNHGKYREVRDDESIKESKRRYINERRKLEREATLAQGVDTNVDSGVLHTSTVELCRHNTEADTDTDTDTRKTKTTRLPALSKSDLVVSGLSDELADAWIEHRKSRRAKLTKISWSALVREAGKARWSLDDAVRKAIERNWTTFEAAWVQHNGNSGNVAGEPAWRTEQKERAKAFMPFSHAKPVSTLGEVIENDATRKLG